MQEAGEVVIEEGDEFEVYYDEEFLFIGMPGTARTEQLLK